MGDFIPLSMGNKVVGKIAVDLDTGVLCGQIDTELAAIFKEGIANQLLSISFLAQPGAKKGEAKKSITDSKEVEQLNEQHQKLKEYLNG